MFIIIIIIQQPSMILHKYLCHKLRLYRFKSVVLRRVEMLFYIRNKHEKC
uniref:Uncharacterized protein n=1 Tax=Heterorhabditis bacteriophora TaxID=37862 RepID=A0A1I7WZB3_HETBA